ncbi:MAG: hypothetical protein RIR01_2360 [Bacteroidota bacterium]|jgi:uncharacterized membrane protein HdeD (DUF308 family)
MKKLLERISSPTPKFWKKVQSIGLVAAGVSAAIMASPVALPAVIVTASGYLATIGGTIAAISQLTVEDGFSNEQN